MAHSPLLAFIMISDVSSECMRLNFVKDVNDQLINDASFFYPFQLNSSMKIALN